MDRHYKWQLMCLVCHTIVLPLSIEKFKLEVRVAVFLKVSVDEFKAASFRIEDFPLFFRSACSWSRMGYEYILRCKL
jgi:competence transcription factor ComK